MVLEAIKKLYRNRAISFILYISVAVVKYIVGFVAIVVGMLMFLYGVFYLCVGLVGLDADTLYNLNFVPYIQGLILICASVVSGYLVISTLWNKAGILNSGEPKIEWISVSSL